ncbi:DUF6286 domain-containing protein [Plantactinospora sp. WMMB782]|uniref:DUF6286 domain-containing protein n=1 Tax=Plantactinospora sp. WMMB782 TaxID=3404121 RepID=UPI003B94014B
MRLVNRLGTLLLGCALLAGGLLLIMEVLTVALGRESLLIDRTAWYDTLTSTRLADPWTRTGIVAAGVLGLLILIGQLVRWKPDRLPTRLADGWHLQRRSVERQLAAVSTAVTGVDSASARVRRRGVGWWVQVRAAGDADIAPAVESAIRRELERLGASRDDHVGVRMSARPVRQLPALPGWRTGATGWEAGLSDGAIRVLWTVLGIVLTAIGVVGLIASLGALAGVDNGAPLLWSGLLRTWRGLDPWGLVILGVVGLFLAWLGSNLLGRVLQLRRHPAQGDLDLRAFAGQATADGTTSPGTTRVQGSRLARGLERDLTRDPQVRRASVTLVGTAPQPDLRIQLRLNPRAGLAAVRDHVSAAVDRFRTTSGLAPRRLDVTARIDAAEPVQVR